MTGYAFHATDNIPTQLDLLQQLCDPHTTAHLSGLTLPSGARCWEIGAGAGSIAAWLAADPSRQVLATDIDTGHLNPGDGYEIATHDLTTGPLPQGPWHFIHARLVLLHLPGRHEILRQLADHLAPGGWLMVEEFDCASPARILSSVGADDANTFLHVSIAIRAALKTAGASLDWAYQVFRAMTVAGLDDIHTTTRIDLATAGSVAARLYQTNAQQLAGRLIDEGVSRAHLDAFHRIMQDPQFAALSYPLVSTWARKPAAA